jgi:hypothetical protein
MHDRPLLQGTKTKLKLFDHACMHMVVDYIMLLLIFHKFLYLRIRLHSIIPVILSSMYYIVIYIYIVKVMKVTAATVLLEVDACTVPRFDYYCAADESNRIESNRIESNRIESNRIESNLIILFYDK